MGRRQTIFVDADDVLQRIERCRQADITVLSEQTSDSRDCSRDTMLRRNHLHRARDGWVRYDLRNFAGRILTASERIRWQEAIRDLESAGLVKLAGLRATDVQITKAGWKTLKTLAK